MSPKEFEQVCERLIARCFPHHKVCPQKTVRYADGVTKRIDIYIAERRPGGKRYIIECKHYPIAYLKKYGVETTAKTKKMSKASAAIMLISGSSNREYTNFRSTATEEDVHVIQVHNTESDLVTWIRNIPVMRELRQIIEGT